MFNLLNNLSEVPHQNAVALRYLQNADLSTFSETRHQFDFSNLENICHFYIEECTHQAIKFMKIMTCIKTNYSKFSEGQFQDYWKWFRGYNMEILQYATEHITKPDWQRINSCIEQLKTSGITELEILAEETSRYLRNKFGLDKERPTVKIA